MLVLLARNQNGRQETASQRGGNPCECFTSRRRLRRYIPTAGSLITQGLTAILITQFQMIYLLMMST